MVKAAIIGSGNIGTDLLIKALRSNSIDPVWVVGIDPDSDGLAVARKHGVKTTHAGIEGLIKQIEVDNVQIVFDATSAYAHAEHDKKLQDLGVFVIDLTPAAVGPYCIPPVNLQQHLDGSHTNLNMVTCGGQATIPMVAAVSSVQPVEYAEIVATVAARSAGPGTRQNIDEFTRTTAGAVVEIGGAKKGKAIIILNPAEPPMVMRDTIHCLTEGTPRQDTIEASVRDMVEKVQRYVPGYQLKNGPVFDGRRVTVFMEVEGLGDYLPKFSGNLDIMTAAALQTAEAVAERITSATSNIASGGGQEQA